MIKKSKIKRGLRDPKKIVSYLLTFNTFKFIPDEIYLKLQYRLKVGKRLNLSNPITYNEKIQWLKLYDRKSKYKYLVDKYKVRTHVEKVIGEEYLIPLIGVYDSYEEIDFSVLPKEFVLKPNHTSGDIYICKDKSNINHRKLLTQVNKWMQKDYYIFNREWPYKNIKPKIICEKLMVDESGSDLKDYKFFCFNGDVKLIQVDFDRFQDHKRNFYNVNWELQHMEFGYPSSSKINIRKPEKIDKMIELAKTLSKGFPHLRIDFYSINHEVYFGEITFYPEAGFKSFYPLENDTTVGNWIQLSIDN